MFQIAAKAERLLQEILSSNKSSRDAASNIKQEPLVQHQQAHAQQIHQQQQQQQQQQLQQIPNYQNPYMQAQQHHQPNYHLTQQAHPQATLYYAPNQMQQYYQTPAQIAGYQVMPQTQYIYSHAGPSTSGLTPVHSSGTAYTECLYFQKQPPPFASNNGNISIPPHLAVNSSMVNSVPQTYYYQQQNQLQQQNYRPPAAANYYQNSFNPYQQNVMMSVPYQPRFQTNPYIPRYGNPLGYQNKRKYNEINNGPPTNNFNSFNKKFTHYNNNGTNQNQINSYTSSTAKNVNETDRNTNKGISSIMGECFLIIKVDLPPKMILRE